MTKYNLSVVVPSIRIQNLEKIHFMLERAIEPYSFEMIVVGPYELPDSIKAKESIKFIKDFGSPGRCVQIGSLFAEGELMCWMSDDCVFVSPQSLAQCISLYESGELSEKDGITLRYFEGEGNNEFPIDYWIARTHSDQQISGIKEGWKIAPLGMYNTKYFRDIGGLDCRWEHINMNTHDLAFRVQNNGGKIVPSPQTVARFYWSWITSDAKPVQEAYFLNDKNLFQQEWNKDQSNRIKIDYWNWVNAASIWKRRFGG